MSSHERLVALQERLKKAQQHVHRAFATECAERALARCIAERGEPPEAATLARAVDAMRAHPPGSSEVVETFRALMAYASRHGGAQGMLASAIALALTDGGDAWEVARSALSLCTTSDAVDAEVTWMHDRLDTLAQMPARPRVVEINPALDPRLLRQGVRVRYGAPPPVFDGDEDGAREATRARSSRLPWA
jgi:hypothetical protein